MLKLKLLETLSLVYKLSTKYSNVTLTGVSFHDGTEPVIVINEEFKKLAFQSCAPIFPEQFHISPIVVFPELRV